MIQFKKLEEIEIYISEAGNFVVFSKDNNLYNSITIQTA